jgi:hypothetical protein
MARVLYIIDRTLRGLGGHSLGYDLAVADAARAIFDRVEIHADRQFVGQHGPLIHRSLGSSGTEKTMRLVKRVVRMASRRQLPVAPDLLGFSGQDRWQPARKSKRLAQILAARDLFRDCRRIVAKAIDHGDEVHVFFQSTDMAEFLCLPRFVNQAGLALNQLTFHLVLRHGPERTCSGFEPVSAFVERLASLSNHQRIKVRLYTDTRQLQNAYLSTLPPTSELRVLPIPVAVSTSAVAQARDTDWIRLSVLGSPRMEKGAGCLIPLLDLLPSDLGGRRIELAVQVEASRDDDGAEDIMRGLEQWDGGSGRPLLSLLRGPADEQVYAQWHAQTDIALMLYTSPKYALSSSGVFAEALFLGKPCIVFRGTWMAGIIEDAARQGFRIGVAVCALAEVPDAVRLLVADLDGQRQDAHVFAQEWARIHSPERLVQVLMEAQETSL